MEQTIVTRLINGEVDHPAPSHCPTCGTKLIASLIYPYEEEIYESKYCVTCGVNRPKPLGDWSKENPTPEDFFEDPETAKGRRERMMGRGPWG